MQTARSYKSKFKTWFITLVILLVAGTVSVAVICQTQIQEMIRISQSEEIKDRQPSGDLVGEAQNVPPEDHGEKRELAAYITPLSTIRVIALAGIAGAWVGMAVWYWLLVAFWMKSRTAKAGYHARFWFLLTLLTNVIAVAIYELLLRIPVVCPHCLRLNPKGSYCAHCGSRMDRNCPGCGQRLSRDAKYCTHCGSPVQR